MNRPHLFESVGFIERTASRFFHDRRLVALIILLILVAGLSSIAVLPRMEDPVLNKRVALVNTRMPGADAKRVESLVSIPIEDQLREIEEIKEVRSVSRSGISTVSIELLDEVTDTDPVWSRVRSRIEDSLPLLPPDATRPQFEELDVRAYALIVAVTWNREQDPDIRVLRRLAIDLQDVLQNLPGTDTVDRFADPGEEIEVELDPARITAMGLTVGEVANQLANFDSKQSAGQLRRDRMRLTMQVGNQLDEIEQIGDVPIRESESGFVRLDDVARIRVGIPDPPGVAASVDGKESVVLGVMVRPSYRIDHWTAGANEALDEFSESLPAGIGIDKILEQSKYVDQRLGSLVVNLLLGAGAVSMVILLMMGWRSALIVTMTLPLASLMVLFFLRAAGIPIHQMSITGLIISLGLLIDNAIVVVDEVTSRLRKGNSRAGAMASAVKHLTVPLIGSTLTTALAFAPIALMPGPAGEFVGAIAISVIFAIASSLFLALTIIPAIASRILPEDSGSEARGGGWGRRLQRLTSQGIKLPALSRLYERALRLLLRRPALGVGLAVVTPILGFAFFPTLQEQFFPPSGRNQFHVTVEGPATSSLAQTRETAESIDAIMKRYDVRRVDWFFGESAPQFYYNVVANRRGTLNYAQALVTTGDEVDSLQMVRDLQDELRDKITSARVLVRQFEQGPPFEAPVEVRVFGPDLETLRQLGEQYRRLLSSIPQVTYVRTDLAETLPQVTVDVDSESARLAGLLPSQVASQLLAGLEGSAGGSVLQDSEELPVVVRVNNAHRESLDHVFSMDVMTAGLPGTARPVPLSALAGIRLVPKSAAIPRLDRRRMNEVAAYIDAGVLPSEVQTQIESLIESSGPPLPPGYRLEFGGEASKRDDAVGNLFSTVGVLAVLMLSTLVLSFSSFRMTAIIAAVAALSVGLGMAALEIGGYPFGFMAIIGTMGLIGVAINDSIVVLAAIRANPVAATGDLDAMVDEVMHSSRHVFATTLTTMAGFTPLIIDGGLFWPPMAICIAGGVAGATILALVLVPAAYRILVSVDTTGQPADVAV